MNVNRHLNRIGLAGVPLVAQWSVNLRFPHFYIRVHHHWKTVQ